MSTQQPPSDTRTYFEQQRDELVQEVALSLEHVLQNMNKLNRNLEQVIAVGHEFSSVEALWSQFENVMARDAEEAGREGQDGGTATREGDDGDETEVTAKDEKA